MTDPAPDDRAEVARQERFDAAVVAATTRIMRLGVGDLEFGYFDDDPDNVTWWARVKAGGNMAAVDGHASPLLALAALAADLEHEALTGTCQWRRCPKTVQRIVDLGAHPRTGEPVAAALCGGHRKRALTLMAEHAAGRHAVGLRVEGRWQAREVFSPGEEPAP